MEEGDFITEIEVLNSLAKFLKEEIASEFLLKKMPKNNRTYDKYQLVNPAVYVGWIPPKGFKNDYGFTIPCLVVMTDNGQDDYNSASITARIKIVTYDAGLVTDDNLLTPGLEGYKDLLNIVDKIRLKLANNTIINEKVNHGKPVEWSIDEEQSYPIWSGEVSFPVDILSLKTNYRKHL